MFTDAGLSLFPAKRQDLKTGCSCPDSSNPCKHIAAAYYLLGEEFDRDPFLILALRGMSREALMERLGTKSPKTVKHQAASGAAPTARASEPLSSTLETFWNGGSSPPREQPRGRDSARARASGSAAGRVSILARPVAAPGDAQRNLLRRLATRARCLCRASDQQRRRRGRRLGHQPKGIENPSPPLAATLALAEIQIIVCALLTLPQHGRKAAAQVGDQINP